MRRLYVRAVPFVVALVASVNLTVGAWLDTDGTPIRLHDDGSLTHLVHVEQRTTDRRYAFYLELGDVAAGEYLRGPEGPPIVAWMTRGLAGVEYRVAEYDVWALPSDLYPRDDPIGVMATPDGEFPYWILPGEGPRWVAYYRDGFVIVPDAIAPFPGADS